MVKVNMLDFQCANAVIHAVQNYMQCRPQSHWKHVEQAEQLGSLCNVIMFFGISMNSNSLLVITVLLCHDIFEKKWRVVK